MKSELENEKMSKRNEESVMKVSDLNNIQSIDNENYHFVNDNLKINYNNCSQIPLENKISVQEIQIFEKRIKNLEIYIEYILQKYEIFISKLIGKLKQENDVTNPSEVYIKAMIEEFKNIKTEFRKLKEINERSILNSHKNSTPFNYKEIQDEKCMKEISLNQESSYSKSYEESEKIDRKQLTKNMNKKNKAKKKSICSKEYNHENGSESSDMETLKTFKNVLDLFYAKVKSKCKNSSKEPMTSRTNNAIYPNEINKNSVNNIVYNDEFTKNVMRRTKKSKSFLKQIH